MAVTITGITPHSPAARKGVAAGDRLLTMNGHEIGDVLDYRFFLQETHLRLTTERDGKRRVMTIRKGEEEELGLEFETYLMDSQHACRNKCVFCFIDQLPPGMRESLYFKDDDSRLSFLFGNYITLTNLSEHEVSRIIDMHISPINISVHTTNPELRCRMMNNRFAGDRLEILHRFAEAGLQINCQLVLCPGWNDGEELSRSLNDLAALAPAVKSVAAVPVGLTKYREGLEPLRLFTKDEAADVIDRMLAVGDRMLEETGNRLFYPSDEFFLKAERPIPTPTFYGEFAQLENGVGMWALTEQQFMTALEQSDTPPGGGRLLLATGVAAAPLIKHLVARAQEKWPTLQAEVVAIVNHFFGEDITVAGLVTGGDLIDQLRGREADAVIIPDCMLRREGDRFLDDVTPAEVEQALGTQLLITATADAGDLLDTLLQQ